MTWHVFYCGKSQLLGALEKQTVVALSSCETEYMAAKSATCQAVWLRGLLSELTSEDPKKVKLHVDNKYVISLMKNPVFHKNTKQINTRFHFIRERIAEDRIKVEHLLGDQQTTYILTNARIKLKEMQDMLRVQDLLIASQQLEG